MREGDDAAVDSEDVGVDLEEVERVPSAAPAPSAASALPVPPVPPVPPIPPAHTPAPLHEAGGHGMQRPSSWFAYEALLQQQASKQRRKAAGEVGSPERPTMRDPAIDCVLDSLFDSTPVMLMSGRFEEMGDSDEPLDVIEEVEWEEIGGVYVLPPSAHFPPIFGKYE